MSTQLSDAGLLTFMWALPQLLLGKGLLNAGCAAHVAGSCSATHLQVDNSVQLL